DLGYAERNIAPDRAVGVVLAREGGHSIKMFDIPPTSAGQVAVVPAVVTSEPLAVADPAPPASEPLAAANDPSPAANSTEPAIPAIIIARGDSATIEPAQAKPGAAELGVKCQALTPDLAGALGATGVEGLLVLGVTSESAADHAGVHAGDIIFKVGDRP